MRILFIGLLILAAMVIGLAVNAETDAAQEYGTPPCQRQSENYYMLTSYRIETARLRLICVYGRAAAMPCAAVSQDGFALRRAVVKPDGRVKCFYAVIEGQ